MRKLLPAVAAMLALPALAAATPSIPANPTLQQAVDGAWRTPAFVKRDPFRHPQQALEFFGIQPNMTVVELDPAGGWWTEILAPYLKAQGQLIEAIPPADSTGFMKKMRAGFMQKMQASPALYSKVKTVPFAPPDQVDLGPPNSADMVLTFRNLHDWEMSGGLAKVFQAAYAVLKPGGVFGVVAHRALPYADPEQSAHALHRLPEDFVIQLGLDSGFRLAAVSEINANPKDPLDINIHHLPPDLSHDTAAQKKKYEAIGESDRMTLKFVKPATAGDGGM